MSELTLTVLRLGLLVALWAFVFAVVGVLRGDLYGTRVRKRAGTTPAKGNPAPRTPRRERTPKPPRAAKGPTRLVVTAGPLSGTTLPLRASGTLIGRSPECALVLDDDYASGRHARIFEGDDGRWMVEDLRSTNGTYLGATRLTEPREVAAGSVLRIGQTTLELQR
ncbi:FHA domain-containing protein [Phycicoccus sp. MAQZ13P-2]|uniref:FHA domain-containing protein FhaB/FipA n=1 Tax=Phycicoccus mangrovi TaxID=2840470 RepID=UPI001C000691|nr:FHA domain-containing protein [Phycicoccus mangrovi]MBT9255647.1 FHA domain-containing protein [Phycicoccus mangrovi]MBT9275361.1 FHA domain-containing protein [Phycicoccus mangrovi]